MKKKILVVDDNRMVLTFLSNLLHKEGHEVKICEDGLSALSLLTTYQPDVVFVDLILPKIGGDKLCQIIRTMDHLKNCFLVILSAAVADIELDYSALGINACIAKGPFGEMGTHVLAAIEDSAESSLLREQGEIRGIAAIGGVPGYARRMTKELLGRTQHLETVLESLSEAIVEVYAGQVVYANTAAVKLFSLPLESMLSARPRDLFDKATRRRIDAFLEKGLDNPSNVIGIRRPIERDGRQIVIRCLPVEGEGDTIILLINDVTEQRNLEVQLQHTRRMEAIGNISGGIAHNFNNLLMGIQGNVSVLNQDLKAGDPGFDELASIERCVENGSKLTRQLLSFAKSGQYTMDWVDLNEIVDNSILIFTRKEKKIRVSKALDRKSAVVRVDSIQIELVLMELFANARQAMAGEGTLRISTAHVFLDESFTKPHRLDPGDYIRITVADTGSGMDETTLQRIFEPFYSTRHMTERTGLGLASVFGILKEHQGLIAVESRVGKGTTFFVYLPVASTKKEAKESEAGPKTALAFEPEKGTGTILMVDDEEVILDAGAILLSELGYDVLLASGGRKALQALEANRDRIDLMILDLVMPDVDGEVVYQKIKQLRPELPVILSSGYDIDDHVSSILKGTGDNFIQKPYSLVQLAQKVKKTLAS